MRECLGFAKGDTDLRAVSTVSADGRVESVLYFPNEPVTACAASKLYGLRGRRLRVGNGMSTTASGFTRDR